MLRFLQMGGLVLVLLLAACSPLPETQTTPAHSPLPTRALSPLPAPAISTEADAAVRAAVADLAAKRKVAPEKVQVISVEAVDWPDTSMGCPQPGKFYAQVIVQGYKIVLSVDGQQVEYHADRQGHVGTCPTSSSTRLTSPLPTPGRSDASAAAVHAAITDLAARRNVAPDTVQVVSVEDTDWSDTSLGCPQPGMFYAQIIVQGYRIVLSVGGQRVEYHADRKGRVVTCGN